MWNTITYPQTVPRVDSSYRTIALGVFFCLGPLWQLVNLVPSPPGTGETKYGCHRVSGMVAMGEDYLFPSAVIYMYFR